VAILLSCRNGQSFLPEFLHSLLEQTHADWTLHWRDDDSGDDTVRLMSEFAARLGPQRARRLEQPDGRLGVTRSFLALLRAATAETSPDMVAFADQDDVWLPGKLARGVAALQGLPDTRPALYCARQILVDRRLSRLGLSAAVPRTPGFPTALTQNIATGCTVMLNRSAALLVAGSRAPGCTLHDWWSYLLVTAAGGAVLMDETPMVLYRQHRDNAVGAPRSVLRRAASALRRGPGAFMAMFRAHVLALRAQPRLLAPSARKQLDRLDRALAGGMAARLTCLGMPELRRQSWYETAVFACWFVMG
jgi:glycosyltransferase involved in cell wall biosynthesis